MHSVQVIAPESEKSAIGHAITLRDPLRVQPVELMDGEKGYAVSGTPADCIKLAINEILTQKPDMVISGINPGANVGVSINYSGTVAAAREAALYGLPAIAVAMEGFDTTHYEDNARFIEHLIGKVARHAMPLGTFLNVNMPHLPLSKIAGVKICNQESSLFYEYFEKRTDPRNRVYYWQGWDMQRPNQNPDSDVGALRNRYISITPVKCDMTDYAILEDLKRWGIQKKWIASDPA